MKLYHATAIANEAGIDECGLIPQITRAISSADQRIEAEGVYGFTNIHDAVQFGKDNWVCIDEFVVYEFEAEDNVFDDPEYDGCAKFVETSEPIMANKVEIN